MADDYVTEYMLDNNLFPHDDGYYGQYDDPVETDIDCPRCLFGGNVNKLMATAHSNSPDDYYTVLTCPVCHYEEQE